MINHLPECPVGPGRMLVGVVVCQCEILRACEQRVRIVYAISHVRDEQAADGIAFGNGYAAGIDAAEAAVAELTVWQARGLLTGDLRPARVDLDDAVAAIRALKEKQ